MGHHKLDSYNPCKLSGKFGLNSLDLLLAITILSLMRKKNIHPQQLQKQGFIFFIFFIFNNSLVI